MLLIRCVQSFLELKLSILSLYLLRLADYLPSFAFDWFQVVVWGIRSDRMVKDRVRGAVPIRKSSQVFSALQIQVSQADSYKNGVGVFHACVALGVSLREPQVVKVPFELHRVVFREVPLHLGSLVHHSQLATLDNTKVMLRRTIQNLAHGRLDRVSLGGKRFTLHRRQWTGSFHKLIDHTVTLIKSIY